MEPKNNDWFEERTQSVVRGLLAIITVVAVTAFVAFGLEVPDWYTLLTGAAAGFFIGKATNKPSP